ncbi:hypothetical protein [Microbispora triticiradicis]|uniref:hypothetical protein n=1 Tax=Microbispora TaxID=2005 RepID=UPI001FCAA0A2|nr:MULTISPECIES: hypothetical protein [Microbispora]
MPAAVSPAVSSAASWLVFGLSCVLVAAGGALGGADPVDAAVALGFTPLGAYLVARRRGGAVGPCCLVTVLGAVAYFADSYSLRPGLPGGRWAAWVGTPRPPLGVSVPLRFQDEVLGVLGLSGGDVRVLAPLASHAGAALAAAHRAAALQRSRTLLVTGGRRSGGGSAGTCTTGWAPSSRASASRWTPRATR